MYWGPIIERYEKALNDIPQRVNVRKENKKLYWCWKSIKQRCTNPKCNAYKNYGKRGIKVCDKWMEFENFLEWAMSNGWENGLEIDRTDNNGDYCEENCRWVTRRENINNRRNTVFITVSDVTKPLTQWSDEIKVDRALITYWVKKHGKGYASERIKQKLQKGNQ